MINSYGQGPIHDLLIEWDLYEDKQQEATVSEYRNNQPGAYTRTSILNFLKQNLEIEGYWCMTDLV